MKKEKMTLIPHRRVPPLAGGVSGAVRRGDILHSPTHARRADWVNRGAAPRVRHVHHGEAEAEAQARP